jgi:hypothetical protein
VSDSSFELIIIIDYAEEVKKKKAGYPASDHSIWRSRVAKGLFFISIINILRLTAKNIVLVLPVALNADKTIFNFCAIMRRFT